MLDFLKIATRSVKNGMTEIYPKFIIKKSNDLMIRGGDFYAIWIDELGLWSTDEDDVVRLIDNELENFAKEHKDRINSNIRIAYMWDAESGTIDSWHKYCQKQMRDSFHMLDEKLIFSNTATNKKDYASKCLPYPLIKGEHDAWDKLVSTLYSEEERHKIEWAIGAIVSGESKNIQKFMVLYGAAGTGKSTILNVIQHLFEGYYSVFDAKALGSSSNSFALEAFKTNPLVAIQHDGDLSRIEDNTRLNSLVSHELMTVNEKFKSTYSNRFKAFLFMGTNKPVKITDAKSGLIRRLIDVAPSGNKLAPKEYKQIVKQIEFELGAIAYYCQEIYLEDPGYYDDYTPITMMGASNDFYNFILDSFHVFQQEDGTTLKAAWEMYKTYCDDARVPYPLSQKNFKEELKNYFKEFNERFNFDDGSRVRSYYSGFRTEKFDVQVKQKKEKGKTNYIQFDSAESIFDYECGELPAQYASVKETPKKKWDDVTTKLSDLDTSKLHFVRVPENHIVIDFDIPDENGKKCFEKNLEEASKWPATYAELSKSGAGIHLHYIYTGDPSKLSRVYDDHIEIKVFNGNSSLRRKLTKCNNVPVATISSGLPMKGENKLINWEGVKNEKILRTMIKRNLNKEYHGATKPSVDYIYKLLEDAYSAGMSYDVSDMQNAILAFAANSTNQADYCIKLVNKMHFKSDEPSVNIDGGSGDELVFYDVEVFKNLFIVCWKIAGEGKPIVKMINPTPTEIEELLRFKLVGFNVRRYDNHILYARLMGYTNEQLYNLSQKIVNSSKGSRGVLFGEAYNLSYTDIYDFSAKKQSLKKWEIELGIHHQELGLPWDKEVDEKLWETVADYCTNDVIATEAVFNHLQGDWTARQILAELAGMTVNDTTNSLTTRIVFGKEKHPNLVYTDLSETFPGYEFKDGKNMYRGTDLGFGGYVYAEPGMYTNVALLDVASLHPHSIIAMNCFGEYTQHFKDILDARMFIKHDDFDSARKMLGGKLAPYLDDESTAKDLAQALKIAINLVYGLTSANFDNPFRDIRNKNNIVALRGALFMRTLQDEVVSRGFTVAHIKTDSIKIPNATPEIIQFCMEFANKYGYTFEHEATYDRMCLVNDAVYIAKYKNGKHAGEWTATGTQFAVPYVFKTLFSKEPIEFNDMCETKSVTSSLYLDMNEGLPDVSEYEKQYAKLFKEISDVSKLSDPMTEECQEMERLGKIIADGHSYQFIGKVGQFCPIKPGCGGGLLMREKDGKYYAATGSKGYRWLESEMVKTLGKEADIDKTYYTKLVDDAADAISEFGDFEWFTSDNTVIYEPISDEMRKVLALVPPCGNSEYGSCIGCPDFTSDLECKKGYDISHMIQVNDNGEFITD